MDGRAITLLTFGAYLVVLLGIGVWGDRRYGRTYAGFLTGDKSFGPWVAAISSAASSESAWVMLGLSGLGYAQGIAAYWASIGCVLGFLCTSLFVVVQLRRSSGSQEVLTLGDYLERAVGDPGRSVRTVSALLIAFFMQVYVVAQFVGAGKQMAGMQLLGYRGGVIVGAIIIGIYVLIGGYAAVCWTDLLQGLLMAVVMLVFPLLALVKAGGLAPVHQALQAQQLSSFWSGGQGLTWGALGFAMGQLGIGLGYPGMPHAIIRFITVRDDRAARGAAIIGVGWGLLVLFGSASLGVVGRVVMPGLTDPEHILPAFTAAHLHPIIGGIILAAVSAAIMSTADSQLMMAATAVVHDLWRPLARQAPGPDGARLIGKTRLLIGVLSSVALGLALMRPRVIYTLVLFAWGALGAAFTPVILLSLHWRRLTWQGALTSLVCGPLTVVVWKLIPGLSSALYELFPGAIVATVAAVLVSRATMVDDGVKQGVSAR